MVLCAMLLCGASAAMAQNGGVSISIVVQFPPTATVGDQDVAASLRLENRSTGDYADDTFRVDQITLTPTCGSQLAFGICPAGGEEPGVFVPSAGTGRLGTACAGRTFTITLLEAGRQRVARHGVRRGAAVVLSFSAWAWREAARVTMDAV